MGKGRLEAFSDGVIAVIITIMVLEMKVPHGVDPAALHARLAGAPIDPTSCDALFISCTNLRADEIAGDLSVDLGVHVFGSNSAIISSLNAFLRT